MLFPPPLLLLLLLLLRHAHVLTHACYVSRQSQGWKRSLPKMVKTTLSLARGDIVMSLCTLRTQEVGEIATKCVVNAVSGVSRDVPDVAHFSGDATAYSSSCWQRSPRYLSKQSAIHLSNRQRFFFFTCASCQPKHRRGSDPARRRRRRRRRRSLFLPPPLRGRSRRTRLHHTTKKTQPRMQLLMQRAKKGGEYTSLSSFTLSPYHCLPGCG